MTRPQLRSSACGSQPLTILPCPSSRNLKCLDEDRSCCQTEQTPSKLHELVDIVQAALLLGLQVVVSLGSRHPPRHHFLRCRQRVLCRGSRAHLHNQYQCQLRRHLTMVGQMMRQHPLLHLRWRCPFTVSSHWRSLSLRVRVSLHHSSTCPEHPSPKHSQLAQIQGPVRAERQVLG